MPRSDDGDHASALPSDPLLPMSVHLAADSRDWSAVAAAVAPYESLGAAWEDCCA
jgi:hypothetical protein